MLGVHTTFDGMAFDSIELCSSKASMKQYMLCTAFCIF